MDSSSLERGTKVVKMGQTVVKPSFVLTDTGFASNRRTWTDTRSRPVPTHPYGVCSRARIRETGFLKPWSTPHSTAWLRVVTPILR